ncbi:MAG: selenoneine biosynthesis selenosugar synthase SenB [Betaproteobacteria bacterium]
MPRPTRPRIALVTPYGARANNGNWHTAARWARWLAPVAQVQLATRWDGAAADALIALHARRSAASIAAFAAAHPQQPLIVVLTGTDVYRDIEHDPAAQRSLQQATTLVALNALAPQRLPPPLRDKAVLIPQSARPLAPGRKAQRYFDVAIVGHLRPEKNPQLVWRVAAQLPADTHIRLWHAGAALDAALGRQARAAARAHPHYRWLGNLPRAQARQLMRRCHLLLHPSHMEGGAQAVIEAVTAHTPVLASRIDGNVGLLGAGYGGYFAPDDADQATALLLAAAHAPRLLARLARQCRQAAREFSPAREAARVRALLAPLRR